MVRSGTVDEAIVNNCEHRWYVEHYRHCVYLWRPRIYRTIIIDDMSKVRGPVFISGYHKQKQRCSQMKCRTMRKLLNSGRHKHIEGRSYMIYQTIRSPEEVWNIYVRKMLIIDHLSNIKDTGFIYVRQKHEERWSKMRCRTLTWYFCLEETHTKNINHRWYVAH